jgi:adenosylmethionine-8-amino-7-oxononanoate aminotransferase
VEIALKMSVHAWRNAGQTDKNEFICIAGGYHGETVGALGVTDTPLFRAPMKPCCARPISPPRPMRARPARRKRRRQPPRPGRCGKPAAGTRGRIAAIIVEPLVQCAAGMAMHDPDYVRGLRALCDAHGAHLIADEIAVGCGRTGSFFACEQAAIWPDLLCLSKGISGGYLPLSLVMASDAIYAAFYDDDVRRGFLHSHSYTGNPLACRAALATLASSRMNRCCRNRAFARCWRRPAPLAQDPRARHVRQRGMIWACDACSTIAATAAGGPAPAGGEAARRELLVRPIGTALYVMPPYIIDAEQAQWLGERLHAAFDAALSGKEKA